MAARLRPRCLRELAQRLSRSCATAAADAPPPPLAAAAKRPPRTPIDAEIVSHARKLRVDPHLFSVMMLTAEARQCCGYGRLFPKPLLVRFVAATDADGVAWAVPDASGRLPGRGAYTLASPRAVDLAVSNNGFTRQMKRPVVGMPDLPRRTEAALVTHLAEFARNVAVPQLPPPPGAASSKSRRRQPPAGAGEAEHEWRLCLWAHGDDASTPPAEPAPFPDEALEPPVPVGARSAVRVLFALRRGELEATLGAEGVAAWQSTAVRLPARASAALSAAQWRLEGFRPAARPPGLRASGEAPAGWTPPAEDADSASA